MNKPYVEQIDYIDPIAAFAGIKHMPYSLLLDSSDKNHNNSRYSFVMAQPVETIEVKDGKADVTNWEQRLSFECDEPFNLIRDRIESWVEETKRLPNLPPFQGGLAGLFGYDLGRYIEKLPSSTKNRRHIPDMAVGVYDQVLACDHLLHKSWIFTHAQNKEEAAKKCAHFLGLISDSYEIPPYEAAETHWVSNFTEKDYQDNVRKTIDYIKSGEIFQANLSQRLESKLPKDFDAFVHYVHMREINPAPFACYMNLGAVKISSASPERFVTVKDGLVETCPIKGTRPHVEDKTQDRAFRRDLTNSEKDRAENTMIVDLLRNDLSKVCTPESIDVSDLCKLETFSNVHHLVSYIKGKLEQDKDSIDLLEACFPGGSITGAPKIRAMEIIEELETDRRGPYCGSMGYIGFDGTMDTNILIRTLVYDQDGVSLQVGGGIVADSAPIQEYQETLDKAEGILKSFETQKESDILKKSSA
ncbi:MAG: aminodeoxychorismate synthase component I [Alphaproteobacteria bacterium]|nr:aminodeoxychorismate synthase component I [Alphaproteobacteria bacterium]